MSVPRVNWLVPNVNGKKLIAKRIQSLTEPDLFELYDGETLVATSNHYDKMVNETLHERGGVTVDAAWSHVGVDDGSRRTRG